MPPRPAIAGLRCIIIYEWFQFLAVCRLDNCGRNRRGYVSRRRLLRAAILAGRRRLRTPPGPAAATGASQPRLQRRLTGAARVGPHCGSRMMPSCRNAISIEFHTRGLGSANSCNCRASRAIRSRSATRPEHSGTGFKCASCSAVLSALKHFRQNFLKLCAVHTSSPPKLPLCYRSSRLCGLFGSARLERLAQFHARLV